MQLANTHSEKNLKKLMVYKNYKNGFVTSASLLRRMAFISCRDLVDLDGGLGICTVAALKKKSLFSACGHGHMTLPVTINETLKWLPFLPILIQKSSGGDSAASGTVPYTPGLPPRAPPPPLWPPPPASLTPPPGISVPASASPETTKC